MDFNARAAQWDTPMRRERAEQVARKIAGFVPVTPEMDAMEFGCGTGLVSFALRAQLRSILLVDAAEGMLAVAQHKIDETGEGTLRTALSDLSTTNGLPAGAFDLIYGSMAMHHIVDIDGAVAVLRQLLKPGGRLCIVDLDANDGSFHADEPGFDGHNGFDQRELAARLERHGLVRARSQTFLRDQRNRNGRMLEYSLFILCAEKA
jgi:ubiquinone/menaquinone biosynthesis C-methylase UbiE